LNGNIQSVLSLNSSRRGTLNNLFESDEEDGKNNSFLLKNKMLFICDLIKEYRQLKLMLGERQ